MGYIIVAAALGLAFLLNGCSEWMPRSAVELPPYEGLGYTHREATRQEQLIAASDFSVELVRFEDARYPRSTAFTAPDEIIYEYEPDELMQGVTYRVPVLMNKYLTYRPKMDKHYRVEMELMTLQTRIATGDFKAGHFGRYKANIEARMIVRRPDSRVVLNRVYRLTYDQPRDSFNGRSPSKEMDRGRMYDITEGLFRRLSEETAWDIRRFDAKFWHPEREQVMVPTQKNEVKFYPSKPAEPKVQLPTSDEPTTMEDLIKPEQPAEDPEHEDGSGMQG